jgi:hypothetical protein
MSGCRAPTLAAKARVMATSAAVSISMRARSPLTVPAMLGPAKAPFLNTDPDPVCGIHNKFPVINKSVVMRRDYLYTCQENNNF